MPKRTPDPACCLCGLPYERIGNNPAPLNQTSRRCCDACNEIVTEARIDPKKVLDEIARVEEALIRTVALPLRASAIAAICASRGPGLWAAHKAALEQVRQAWREHEVHAPGDGSESPTQAQ